MITAKQDTRQFAVWLNGAGVDVGPSCGGVLVPAPVTAERVDNVPNQAQESCSQCRVGAVAANCWLNGRPVCFRCYIIGSNEYRVAPVEVPGSRSAMSVC